MKKYIVTIEEGKEPVIQEITETSYAKIASEITKHFMEEEKKERRNRLGESAEFTQRVLKNLVGMKVKYNEVEDRHVEKAIQNAVEKTDEIDLVTKNIGLSLEGYIVLVKRLYSTKGKDKSFERILSGIADFRNSIDLQIIHNFRLYCDLLLNR